MTPLAVLWLLFSAGGPAVVGDQAVAPTPAIEIVVVGPSESGAKTEATIRAVTGSGPDLGWSRQDSLPPDGRASEGGPSRIWLDLRNPAALRVLVPVEEPQGATIVRTVVRPEGDLEDGNRVAREELAHIVKTTVWALQSQRTSAGGRSAPKSKGSSPPYQLDADLPAEFTRAPREISRPSSLLLGGGIHMQPWSLSNDIGQTNGPGFSMLGAGRWQFSQLQLGLRLSWERSGSAGRLDDLRRYDVRSDLFSGALAAAYRLQGRRLSLCVGLQAGVLMMRQRIALTATRVDDFNRASESWSAGPLAGPVMELDWAVSQRIFVHLDLAVPITFILVDDGATRRWDGSAYVQTTLGLGFYL